MPNIKAESSADPDVGLETAAGRISELRRMLVSVADNLRRAPQTRVSTWSAPPLDDEMQRTQLGKLEAVIASLDQIVHAAPETPDADAARLLAGIAHTVLANQFLSAADDNSALEHFRVACDCFAGLAPATLAADSIASQHYIEALERSGRREDVVKFLVDAAETPLSLLPQQIYLQFAWVLMRSGDDENGRRILGLASRRAAGNAGELRKIAGVFANLELSQQAARHYFAAAEIYCERRDFDSALEACTHALKFDPDNLHIRFLRCRLLIDKGRFDEAHRELRELSGLLPGPAARLLLAEVLLHAGNTESALAEIDAVLYENPRNPEALIARARVLNRMDDWPAALEAAQHALAQLPGIEAAAVEKVIALRGLGRLNEALAAAEEILARHPSSLAAHNARLDILLALRMWEDAIRVASDILEVQESDPVLFKRAQAYMESGDPAAALNDLDELSQPGALQPAVARLRLRAHRRLHHWSEVITILDQRIAAEPASVELRFERCDLLRRLGEQRQALEDIKQLAAHASNHPEFIRLKGALLCDIGDFEKAFATVEPLTTPIESPSATHALLSLRAWADQNLPEERYQLDGEAVYRRALELDQNDLWARKGLGNALRRIGRFGEAEQEYNAVIERIEEIKRSGNPSPYLLCLSGWCYYSIGKFKEAAQHYAVGLATADIGPAYNFDYGLILLSDVYPSTAASQYAKGLDSLQSKDILRRCGLLYVALFDILTAMQFRERLANAPETLETREKLRTALSAAVAGLPPGWNEFAETMKRFIREEEQEAAVHQAGWSRYQIAGFERPAQELPWGVLSPLLRRRDDAALLYRMPEDSAALAGALEPVPPGAVVELPEPVDASSDCVILWVSPETIAALGTENLVGPATEFDWQQLSSPSGSWAAVVSSEAVTGLFDHWATCLVQRSLAALVDHFRSGDEPTLQQARRLAELAVLAAPGQTGKYHAVLAFGAAGGDLKSDFVQNACRDLCHPICTDQTTLNEGVERFKRMAQLEAQRKADTGFSAGAGSPLKPVSKNPIVEEILKRAHAIAQVENQDEQDRLAVEAAEEMKLLVPIDEAIEVHRSRLNEQLESHAAFLLDSDPTILLLSHEPEFYNKGVLVPFSNRPGISSIAFASARDRLRARITN